MQEAVTAFSEDTADRQLLMNVEYKGANGDCVSRLAQTCGCSLLGGNFYLLHVLTQVTLLTNETDVAQRKDIARELVADGLLCVETRRDKRLQKLVLQYIIYRSIAQS